MSDRQGLPGVVVRCFSTIDVERGEPGVEHVPNVNLVIFDKCSLVVRLSDDDALLYARSGHR